MASITAYLLVTGAEDIDEVQSHSLIEEHDLDVQETTEGTEQEMRQITFVREYPLENQVDLQDPARLLSTAFPDAVVVLCTVEERFDHIERLQTQVYVKGKSAGDIEHGYVWNVGS